MAKKYVATPIRIVQEGFPFIAGFAVAAIIVSFVGGWFGAVLGLLCCGLSIFSMAFFRDPVRRVPQADHLIVSPADGLVMEVGEEENPFFEGKAQVIKIFLSVIDVHLQRSPCAGKVTDVVYQKGKFLDARNPRASFENENNSIVLETVHGKVVVKQIAGLIARRIISWVEPQNVVKVGQHIGLIRFGSQVDLYLPQGLQIKAKKGDRVRGGETILAEKII